MFDGLSNEMLTEIAAITTAHEVPKGKVIFSDGEEANGFYAIAEGRIKIYKLSPEGKEQILHVFGPGEAFGEVPVFSGRHFPAYAEAIEPSLVLFFPKEKFISLIKSEPMLALGMLADLSRRLRYFANLIENLSLKEVPGRLAAHLLYLSERQEDSNELTLDLNKTQLASLLGTIPETLSRILARMTKEGLIELLDNRQVRILDRESIEELANGERRLG